MAEEAPLLNDEADHPHEVVLERDLMPAERTFDEPDRVVEPRGEQRLVARARERRTGEALPAQRLFALTQLAPDHEEQGDPRLGLGARVARLSGAPRRLDEV